MKKVLIIEDDSNIQDIYREALADLGVEVLVASTGEQGLVQAKEAKPDLIILDIMLPGGMNGFDVIEACKKFPGLEAVPIIILSNLDTEYKTGLKMGASDYFIKANTSIDTVIKKLKKYLQIPD